VPEDRESWVAVWKSSTRPYGQMIIAFLKSKGIAVRTDPPSAALSPRSGNAEGILFPTVFVPQDRLQESRILLQKEGLL